MFNLPNFIQATRYTLYWSLLAGLCAIPVAFVGTFFALLLNQATNFRMANPVIIVFLPIVGFGIVWLYLRFGANANQGNPLHHRRTTQQSRAGAFSDDRSGL
jgi:ABC-type sugar transport system permease subunit